MNKKYLAMREAERYPGEDKTLEVIASSNLKKLSEEMEGAAIPFDGEKTVLVIPYERTVKEMLSGLSARSHRTPLMRGIRTKFESDYGYMQYWGAHEYAREDNKKTPTLCSLNFPKGSQEFVVGLVHGRFNVMGTIALPEYTNPSA
jgi:hypothetical protein